MKYFYALRPLLAAQYIERYHEAPPVLFDDLLKLEMPVELRGAIGELLERKKKTAEGEEKPQMPVIRDFIREETARQKEKADSIADDHNKDWAALNRVFREVLQMWSVSEGAAEGEDYGKKGWYRKSGLCGAANIDHRAEMEPVGGKRAGSNQGKAVSGGIQGI